MESSIAVFLSRQSACERLPTKSFQLELGRCLCMRWRTAVRRHLHEDSWEVHVSWSPSWLTLRNNVCRCGMLTLAWRA